MDSSLDTHFSAIVTSIKRIIQSKHYCVEREFTIHTACTEPHNKTIVTNVFTVTIFYQEPDDRFYIRIKAHDNKDRFKYSYHAYISPFSNILDIDLIVQELNYLLPECASLQQIKKDVSWTVYIEPIAALCICLFFIYHVYVK